MESERAAEDMGVLPALRVGVIAGTALALLLSPALAFASPWFPLDGLASALRSAATVIQHLQQVLVAVFVAAGLIGRLAR